MPPEELEECPLPSSFENNGNAYEKLALAAKYHTAVLKEAIDVQYGQEVLAQKRNCKCLGAKKEVTFPIGS